MQDDTQTQEFKRDLFRFVLDEYYKEPNTGVVLFQAAFNALFTKDKLAESYRSNIELYASLYYRRKKRTQSWSDIDAKYEMISNMACNVRQSRNYSQRKLAEILESGVPDKSTSLNYELYEIFREDSMISGWYLEWFREREQEWQASSPAPTQPTS